MPSMGQPLLSSSSSSPPAKSMLCWRHQDPCSQRCFSESLLFTSVVSAIIAANIAVIALESIYIHEQLVLFDHLEFVFATLYTLEMCWRVAERGIRSFLCKGEWWWSWFDLLVVFSSVMEIVMSTLMGFSAEASVCRAFRILRVLRMFRAFRFVSQADYAAARAMQAILRFLLVVALLIFVAAIIATNLLWDSSDPRVAEMFQDLGQSMWSMCKLMTLDDWPQVIEQVSEAKPGMLVFFMTFIFTTSTALVSLVPVVFLELSLKSRSTGNIVNGEREAWEMVGLRLHELSTAIREEMCEMRLDTAQLEKDIEKMIISAKTEILNSVIPNLVRDATLQEYCGTCAADHLLVGLRRTGQVVRCDECKRYLDVAEPFFGCRICNYDLCNQCKDSKRQDKDPRSSTCDPQDDTSGQVSPDTVKCSTQDIQDRSESRCTDPHAFASVGSSSNSAASSEQDVPEREHYQKLQSPVRPQDTKVPDSKLFAKFLQGDASENSLPKQSVQEGNCTPRGQVLLAAQKKLAAFEDSAGRNSAASTRNSLSSEIGSVWKFDHPKGLASQAYAFISDYTAPQVATHSRDIEQLAQSIPMACEAVPRERSASRDLREHPKIWPLSLPYNTRSRGRSRASPARSDSSKDPPSPIPTDCPSADMFSAPGNDEQQTMIL